MPNEHRAYKVIRDNLFRVRPSAHFMRLENIASPGCPDINICYEGEEVWIECKSLPAGKDFLPTTMVLKNRLRAAQVVWMENRHRSGGRCFVLLEYIYDGIRFWAIPYEPGIERLTLEELMARAITVSYRAHWEEWRRFFNRLTE